jgi:hypothetical protein
LISPSLGFFTLSVVSWINIIFNVFKGMWLPSVCNTCPYQYILNLTNFPFSVSIFRSCLMHSLLSFLILSIDHSDQICTLWACFKKQKIVNKSVLFMILTYTEICSWHYLHIIPGVLQLQSVVFCPKQCVVPL